MGNWLQEKAFNLLTGFKHSDVFSLTGSQHRNLADGNLTILSGGNSAGQQSDNKLITEGFERNAQAYSIIRKISETGSDVPWLPKEVKKDGTLEDVKDGRFFDFVMQPNPEQTQKDFKEESFTYMLTTGDLFWQPVESVGFGISELKTWPSQLIEVLSTQSNPLTVSGYMFELGRQKESFSVDELIHLKYVNPTTRGVESLRGLSPLAAAWLALHGDNQRAEAQAAMITNRGIAGIYTNEGEFPLTAEELQSRQALLDKEIGGSGKFNKVLAGSGKGKFLQLGMSSSDLEILKTAIQNLRTLCNVYGAPSELFNDPANKTHANQKAALKSFYENSVLPLDRRVLSKYNSTVVKDWSERDNKNYTVVQDLQHIGALQEDEDKKAARSEKITNSIIKVVAQTKQGLSPDAAANIIAHAHGLPIDEAKKFVSLLNTNQNSNE
jgi:HK97 family phage portal protein